VGLAIGAVIGALLALGHRSTELIQVRQITWSGHIYPGSAIDETFANIVTDGVRLYFRVLDGGRFGIETAPVTGDGNALTSRVTVPADIASPILDDISRDGSELLVGDHAWSALEWPLWIMPTTGGIAHRVSDLYAHDATWMPDRRSILYARGDDLLIYGGPSKSIETFAHLPGRGFRPRWSPDSKRLRVTVVDANSRASSLWEIDVAKRKPIRLFPDSTESQCCGSWAPGGQYYLFQRSAENTSDIWMQSPPSLRTAPGQITGGPLQFSSPVPSPDRGVFFAVGVQTHARLEQFDPQTHHFLPYLPNLATASRYAFSPDGSELAWVSSNDGSLWRSKVDGTQRVQLSSSPFQVFMMSWSPDGRQIAVMGKRPGEPWKLYLVSPGGGDLRPLLKEHHNEADPTWSPDGAQLAFGRSVEYMGEEGVRKAVYVFDTRTKSLKELPGSVGMFSPRWSPNGQYLACATLDQRQLRVFNLGTQTWATVANKGIDNPVWTHDGEWLYFADFTDRNKPIYRVRLADKKVEKVADITDLGGSGNRNYNFFGLSEAGLPVVFADSWSADIFSLNRSERRFQNW
jgi:Tol biopolymer transport system component